MYILHLPESTQAEVFDEFIRDSMERDGEAAIEVEELEFTEVIELGDELTAPYGSGQVCRNLVD